MPENQALAINGVKLGSTAAAIKYEDRNDLLVMEIDAGASVSAVFTRNAFCAAPVVLSRRNLSQTTPRYLIINSGNANAGTGESGLRSAQCCCDAVAEHAGVSANQVLPFSTGVIGEALPIDKIVGSIPAALDALSESGWSDAAHAIMTTDTVAKLESASFRIGDCDYRVTGIAKGSGMIHPNMATMLAFIATDAPVSRDMLDDCLSLLVEDSFNAITVDGDTSTNDACVLIATGSDKAQLIDRRDARFEQLLSGLATVFKRLARRIAEDAEGATKLLEIEVKDAKSIQEARDIAYTVALSPLVKTAAFASDPNWGRILAAVGRAPVKNMDVGKINIYLGETCIVRAGGVDDNYTEEAGQKEMAASTIRITIEMGRGTARKLILSSDLSYDYVKINAEYRT